MSIEQPIYRQDIRRQVDRGRVYVWPPGPDAVEYPSVTTILNTFPKDFLMYWAAKHVAEVAVDSYELLGRLIENDRDGAVSWLKNSPWGKRNRAGLNGTTLHEMCEYWIGGDNQSADMLYRRLDTESQQKARQLRHFLDTVPIDFTHVESVVFDRTVGYAGTIDMIGSITDERLCGRFGTLMPTTLIFDIKTGRGVYPETAMQLSAYRFAQEMLDHVTGGLVDMPETDGAAVIHITAESWALFPVVATTESYQTFLRAKALFPYVPLDVRLIGTPVLRGSP